MPEKLPQGIRISVAKRILPADYAMPIMDMAVDHYSIGYILSGDRRVITPQQSYDSHKGDVSMMPPYLYHRTISLSSAPYENYLIKFTGDIVQPFLDIVGNTFLEELLEQKVHHFTAETQQKITELFEEMFQVYEKSAPYSELILQGMLFRLFTIIYENRIGGGAVYFPSKLSTSIVDALYQMEQRYADNITLEKIAEELNYSAAHFSRLFKKQLGIPFSEYLFHIRLRHVYELLTNTNLSITDIALNTGFCNGDYLSTQFKKKTGMTPKEFRKKAEHK